MSDIDTYSGRYDRYLRDIARNLERLMIGHVSELSNIDRVNARAKEPERFAEKARRLDDDGRLKYHSPLTEIQDQLGVRVVVFYVDDVEPVRDVILRYLRPIEVQSVVPDSDWEFGYFGQHFVLGLPDDAVPQDVDLGDAPRFFELQIKTLFQHAWSEANHDLGYKAAAPLASDHRRRLAFTAAQAWGADRVFNELRRELAASDN